MTSQPIDHLQREAALDPKRSFCVTAPAGSGKTELLSQRVLALLAHVQQPEEILAITFTRKAAAEMRERILHALRAAQLPEPSEAHKRQTWQLARAASLQAESLGWNLLQNPARLRVQTIDGLCSSLTAQMPVLSQFGGQPRIVERAEPLYREAVNALLLQLETDSAGYRDINGVESLAALLLHLDNRVDRLHELLAGLLGCRDQWLPHIGGGLNDRRGVIKNNSETVRAHLENTLRQVRCDALTKLCENMQHYHGNILPLLDFAAARLRESQPDHALCAFAGCVDLPEAQSEAVEQWQSVAKWLLTKEGNWRKKITKNEGFPVGEGLNKLPYKQRKETMELLLDTFSRDDALRELLDEVRYLPAAEYSDEQWQILVHLTQVLVQAVAQLDVVFQIRGEVDFTEISLAALRALGNALNPSELMLRLDQRISHLLIDEFQDTSSTQFRLLERLIEGWREHNESGAAPRTVFIVGDGMQSIYGFREAKVGLFLDAKEQGINQLELIDAPLSVNFRSTPTIVDWNNRVFAEAFPQVEHIARGAVPYENSMAFKAENAFESEVNVFGLRGDPERDAEARHVVELVERSLRRDRDGTIAILVRSRSHLTAIVPALQRANIAFRATDIDPLAQRAHVQDLLALLKALLNPADRIAWLALLRSPLIGLDNRDLHALVAIGDNALRTPVVARLRAVDIRHLVSADQRARLDRVMDIIDLAQRQRARKPLRIWLEGIWRALGGDLLTNSKAAHADIEAVFALIEMLGSEFTVQELERRVQDLYARPSAALDTRVVLMTIHKSKGLEFDTVIIPALDAGARSDEKPLLRWSEYLADDGALGIVLAPKSAIGGDDDAIYRWLEYEHKQQKLLEDTRLLYVAATRAIKRLYLLFRCKDEQEFKNPPSHSLLSRIWPAIQDDVTWIDAKRQPVVDAHSNETLQRVPASWYARPREEMAIGVAENPPQLLAYSLETQIGSALHRVLEMLARFHIDWFSFTPQQRSALIVQVLRQTGVAEASLDAAAKQILQSIDAMLADERGRWLLSNAHAEAVAEWELIADGKRFVIDRSFIERENNGGEVQRWIIDYKNSAPLAGESIDQFAQRELETYGAQLQLYRELVSAFDNRPIRTALYFPRIAHWLEVNGNSK